MRQAAAARLAGSAAEQVGEGEPLVPAADPTRWWGLRRRTTSDVPVRDRRRAAATVGKRPRRLVDVPAALVPRAGGGRRVGAVDLARLRFGHPRPGRPHGHRRCRRARAWSRCSTRCGTSCSSTVRGSPSASTPTQSPHCAGSCAGTTAGPAVEYLGAEEAFDVRGAARRRRAGRAARDASTGSSATTRAASSSSTSRPARTRPRTSRCGDTRSSASTSSRSTRVASRGSRARAPARAVPSSSSSAPTRPACRRSSRSRRRRPTPRAARRSRCSSPSGVAVVRQEDFAASCQRVLCALRVRPSVSDPAALRDGAVMSRARTTLVLPGGRPILLGTPGELCRPGGHPVQRPAARRRSPPRSSRA